jgi:type I site-specific restriction endonuclease
MSNQEMPMDDITLTEMLKEIFEHNKQMQEFMEVQKEKLDEKDRVIAASQNQVKLLVTNFDVKFGNIKVEAPKPDLTAVNQVLTSQLQIINQTIDKGPKPVERIFRLTLFPEQVRNPDYYAVMLTRLVLGVLGVLLLIFGYLLLNRMIR